MLFKVKCVTLYSRPDWYFRKSTTNYPRMFIAHFELLLHAKRSFLFSIVFIKWILFTFVDLLTLIFLLYIDCEVLKARYRENSFFVWKLLFLTLTSSNSIARMLWSWHVRKFTKKYCLVKFLFRTENYITIRSAHFVNIRFILINPGFNKWFKSQRDRTLSNLCHNRVFEHFLNIPVQLTDLTI